MSDDIKNSNDGNTQTEKLIDPKRRKVLYSAPVLLGGITAPAIGMTSQPEPPPPPPEYVPPAFSIAANASCIKEKSSLVECGFIDITDPDAVKFSFGLDVTVVADSNMDTDFAISIDWSLDGGSGGDNSSGTFGGTTSGGSFSQSSSSILEPEIVGSDCILPDPATSFSGTARLTPTEGPEIVETFSVSFSC